MSPYLVCEGWMHCFVGSQETLVRWAYDLDRSRLVADMRCGWKWIALSAKELADLKEDLDTNEALESPDEWPGVLPSNVWPAWALPPAPARV